MDKEILKQELSFRTARSGGAGGQNVNKVETKVEILWWIDASGALSEAEKEQVKKVCASKISKEGCFMVYHQTERSQWANRQLAEKKLIDLVSKALLPEKKRLKTRVPAAVSAERLKSKKRNAEKKSWRQKVRAHEKGSDLSF